MNALHVDYFKTGRCDLGPSEARSDPLGTVEKVALRTENDQRDINFARRVLVQCCLVGGIKLCRIHGGCNVSAPCVTPEHTDSMGHAQIVHPVAQQMCWIITADVSGAAQMGHDPWQSGDLPPTAGSCCVDNRQCSNIPATGFQLVRQLHCQIACQRHSNQMDRPLGIICVDIRAIVRCRIFYANR